MRRGPSKSPRVWSRRPSSRRACGAAPAALQRPPGKGACAHSARGSPRAEKRGVGAARGRLRALAVRTRQYIVIARVDPRYGKLGTRFFIEEMVESKAYPVPATVAEMPVFDPPPRFHLESHGRRRLLRHLRGPGAGDPRGFVEDLRAFDVLRGRTGRAPARGRLGSPTRRSPRASSGSTARLKRTGARWGKIGAELRRVATCRGEWAMLPARVSRSFLRALAAPRALGALQRYRVPIDRLAPRLLR